MSVAGDAQVHVASPADAGETARQHVALLQHGLFPRLGPRFVRLWHAAHQASPYGVLFVAESDGEIVGFLLGTSDQRRHVNWTLENRRRTLGLAGVGALLVRPKVLGLFLRTRAPRYARRVWNRSSRNGDSTSTGTMSAPDSAADEPLGNVPTDAEEAIAVLEALVMVPQARGLGAGSLLVERYLDFAAAQGTSRVELVTKGGPEGASDFYEERGWTQVDEHVDRDGDSTLTYRIDVSGRVARKSDPPDREAS